jgi:hypothetical protein
MAQTPDRGMARPPPLTADQIRAIVCRYGLPWFFVVAVLDVTQWRILEFGYFDCSPGVLGLVFGAAAIGPAVAYPFVLALVWRRPEILALVWNTTWSRGRRIALSVVLAVAAAGLTAFDGFVWLLMHMCP